MSGDGRLDLDELGEVIDHASALGPAPGTETIDDGNGLPWAERLEAAGFTPWVRRHRRLLAGVVVAAVVVTGVVVAYPRLVPPPIDPVLRVTVTPVVPSQYVIDRTSQSFDGMGIFATGTSLRTAYSLTRQSDEDTSTYRIDGIVGPAVRASSASPQPVAQGGGAAEAAREDVDVIVDCFDATPLPVPRGAYSLVVTRTDDRGRTTTQGLPVSDAVANWPLYVTSICLQTQAQFALTPTSVRTTVDRAARTVLAEVGVHNALRSPTTLYIDPSYGPTPIVTTMAPMQLRAGGDEVLRLRLDVHDCTNPALQFLGLPSYPGDQRYDAGSQGIYLGADFGADVIDPTSDPTGNGGRASAPLQFTPAMAREIDAALGSICAGSPDVAVRVVDVGLARKVTVPFLNGNPEATRLPTTVIVTVTDGTRVRVSIPPPGPGETQSSRISARTATVDGRTVRVRTDLDIDCASGFVQPPTFQVDVTTSRGTFPRQVQVTDAQLTSAIAQACPQIGVQQLVEFGWADPRTSGA